MSEKTNKEVINDLEEYFLKQNPKTIARSFAAMLIDLNRIIHLDYLPIEEKVNLIARMQANRQQLLKFIHNGPDGDLTLHNIESETI